MERSQSLLNPQAPSAGQILRKETQIQYVKGVGPKLAELLEPLGITTCEDFCYFFPRKYDDRRALPKVSQLQLNQSQGVIVKIVSVNEKKVRKRLSIIEARVCDDSAVITAVWFNQPYMKRGLQIGSYFYIKGKIETSDYSLEKVIKVAETERLSNRPEDQRFSTVVPIYQLKSGLQQYQLRRMAKTIVFTVSKQLSDGLPQTVRLRHNLPTLTDSLQHLHFPQNNQQFEQAKQRIIFEELLIYQCRILQRGQQNKRRKGAVTLTTTGPLWQAYQRQLPYELTQGQQQAIAAVAQDVQSEVAMNRLVQGDVGCGKTEVALAALLFALDSHQVAAFMAPTQILAEQHYLKLKRLTQCFGIEVFLLKGQQNKKEKATTKAYLSQATCCLVVGTHALIQEDVHIPNLALVVIDEQHRFGVLQRLVLQSKGKIPHALYLTATPIPRSFMLTCFGDLDKSIITMLPSGRKPIQTYLAKEESLERVLRACKARCLKGEQVYIVYPLVEESETLALRSAVEGVEEIKAFFPEFPVDLLHGQMKPAQKAEVMQRFRAGESKILVSTTVIEVGVDVPQATMMVILHADRFGLSQLHQLRGRVGRGQKESSCYLVATPKNPDSKKRIKAMLDHHDGFKIAEIDLQIRGPGDMLGTKQAGLPEFLLADIVRDEQILLKARESAKELLHNDPKLEHPEHAQLKQKVQQQDQHLQENNLN
ncbi:MAG: ATP-dependent DNA helicase RecG [bacterium]